MAALDLSKRWIFYLGLLLFIIAKIPHLSYAFYWDESWVYAPAIYLMHVHGPSILPDAVPILFSRGHPLFFHAACAEWMNIFGATNFSMHCFALLVSVLLAVATYEIMRSLFNYRVALMSGIMLLLNEHFFVESAYVVTDIMLALFTFLALYSYVSQRHFFTVLWLTFLFYTKESGMVLLVVLAADVCINFFNGTYTKKDAALRSASIIIPFIFITAFFVLQKNMFGWYLYPGHTALVHFDAQTSLVALINTFKYVFFKEYIYVCYMPFVLITLVLAIKQKRGILLFFFLSAVFITLSMFAFSPLNVLYHLFIGFLLIISMIFLFKHLSSFSSAQRSFIRLAFIFCVLFVYFSGINFYEDRYLFPVMFLLSVILLAILYENYLSRYMKGAFNYICVLLIVLGAGSYALPGELFGDFDRMTVQQQMIDFVEQKNFYEKKIFCRCFLEIVHLKDKNTGYLRGNRSFNRITDQFDNTVDLAIFDNIDCGFEQYLETKANPEFVLLQKFQRGPAWVEVYKRK